MDSPPATEEHAPEPRRYGRRLFLATVVGGVSSLYWGKAAWDHVTGVVSPVGTASTGSSGATGGGVESCGVEGSVSTSPSV